MSQPAREIEFEVLPPEHVRRSKARTAAIVAGGAGVAYSGYQVGRAALEARRVIAHAAPHMQAAAENASAVTGAVRRVGAPLTKLRRVFRMSVSLRKGVIQFASPSVAADRYRKAIKEHEENRAESNYTRSALAGAAVGALLRRRPMSIGKAALTGAGAGAATQAIVRAATSPSKDQFGDRPLTAKRVEKLPYQTAAVAAGILGYRKIARRGKALGFTARGPVRRFDVAGTVRKIVRNPKFLTGAALAGGITAADAVTSALKPASGETRTQAAGEGAARGAIYGTVLAGAEPLLHSRLTKLVRARRAVRVIAASAGGRVMAFGGRQQLRGNDRRFVDPLDVAAGTSSAYDAAGAPVHLPTAHAQVVRAALNKATVYHRYGTRAGGLVRDASDAVRGVPKTDARGRPQKREWERAWFRNAVGTAATAGALLTHAHVMRRNPQYRATVGRVVRRGKSAANQVVPDLFPMRAKIRTAIQFDATAPRWDVRDERGRSARVFAPGAQSRVRRPKEWYEKADNQRKIATGLVGAALIGGGLLGHRLGVQKGMRTARSAMVKKAWGTRRAAKAENEAIERMRRGGGGSPVS